WTGITGVWVIVGLLATCTCDLRDGTSGN
ncbi:MAG: hypothetical protein JWR28_310, partial [Modestobacter sp.]|nr:hypothetical protein [Modestobacter sp.]